MKKPRKRKGKLKLKQKTLVHIHKKDKTNVERPDTSLREYPRAPIKVPSNGVVFKVKVRRK